MIIDAEGAVLGRFASKVAKELLKGETIVVINADKAIVTGNPEAVFDKYFKRRQRGDPHHGPYYPRYPERILRRTVRGMVPYKKDKGEKAFKRLKVIIGNPENLTGEKISKTSDSLKCKFVTLGEISKRLGAKFE